jgi:predicted nuclease of predicted toxin-antitoxin system
MSAAADSEILAIAAQSGSIVVTLDADFHTILAVSGMSAPSAIRLRLQPVDAIGVAAIVQEILTSFDAQLKGGCLITAKAHKITCHGLPIGGKAE